MDTLPLDRSPTSSLTRHLYPVILCGGSGKRLWPLSRQALPKQFLPLMSDLSLLQQTVERACGQMGLRAPLVVCSADHRFMVTAQLAAIDRNPDTLICEPMGRNTAPALTAAAMALAERDPEAIMLVLPSDHHVGDSGALLEAVTRAASLAEDGYLVTFGILPSRPETGYGYIQRGAAFSSIKDAYAVARFVEKPDRATAETLIADGTHSWNSGMFVLPVALFLEEMRRYQPDVIKACAVAVGDAVKSNGSLQLDAAAFSSAPDISIDYAVMEKTDKAAMVCADIGWSDIGSWHSLRDAREQDEHGNVLEGDVLAEDLKNSFIRSNGRLVAAIGLRDIIVIDTDDVVLVTDIAHAKDVGNLVEKLRKQQRSEASHHARVERPWGYYESIDMGTRFQVKHIMVQPGAQLSLQMHHHRAEHWIVVSGTGRVTCGDIVRLLGENESIFIPLGTTHRLENPGKVALHLVEVQVGSYLGEDDIVRFQDDYGRV